MAPTEIPKSIDPTPKFGENPSTGVSGQIGEIPLFIYIFFSETHLQATGQTPQRILTRWLKNT